MNDRVTLIGDFIKTRVKFQSAKTVTAYWLALILHFKVNMSELCKQTMDEAGVLITFTRRPSALRCDVDHRTVLCPYASKQAFYLPKETNLQYNISMLNIGQAARSP